MKLVACPARASEDHGWQVQLFLGADQHLYERHRCTVNNGHKAERWFIITNFEVKRYSPEEWAGTRIQ